MNIAGDGSLKRFIVAIILDLVIGVAANILTPYVVHVLNAPVFEEHKC